LLITITLPSLEGLVNNSDIASEVNLGPVEIPMKKIIGTYSHLRSLCFAKNFMPLLEKKSEFQTKWTILYYIQLFFNNLIDLNII